MKIFCRKFLFSFILLLLLLGAAYTLNKSETKIDIPENVKAEIETFAAENGLTIKSYPDEILALLCRNEETKDFVLNYPLKVGSVSDIDMSVYENCNTVPLFMQWDERWGYKYYGSSVMGVTGCGPVCLSMVATYLLKRTDMDPAWMADFAIENGFCTKGSGTSWQLMSTGAEKLGLDAEELPLVEKTIIDYLKDGKVIICVMGPGDFTTSGHYIVLTGYENGKIKINDPNSASNSNKEWEFEQIKDQIRNLWVYK